MLRRDLRRGAIVAFLDALEPTELVFEACGASHHWGREAMKRGHAVRLIPPQYVKPFRKRGKNDRADAAAQNDAASRPDMASVPVKSEARQAEAISTRIVEFFVTNPLLSRGRPHLHPSDARGWRTGLRLKAHDLARARAKPRITRDRTMAGAVPMSIACGASEEVDIT